MKEANEDLRSRMMGLSDTLLERSRLYQAEVRKLGQSELAERLDKSVGLLESQLRGLGDAEDLGEFRERYDYMKLQLEHLEGLMELCGELQQWSDEKLQRTITEIKNLT